MEELHKRQVHLILLPPAAFSSTVSVAAVRVETAAGCTATDTLDLFYNDIDVKGTIGQVSTTLCSNETSSFTNDVAATASIGAITYRWETRTSGTAFENTIPAVTTAVYTPTTGLTTTTFYRRVGQESTYGGATCEEYSNIIQITINDSPVAGLQVGGVAAPGNMLFVSSGNGHFYRYGRTIVYFI